MHGGQPVVVGEVERVQPDGLGRCAQQVGEHPVDLAPPDLEVELVEVNGTLFAGFIGAALQQSRLV